MNIEFHRLEEGSIKQHKFASYKEANLWVESEINKFKICNRVQNEKTDKSFISFKSELEELLKGFKDG